MTSRTTSWICAGWLCIALPLCTGCPQTSSGDCSEDSECPTGRYCGPTGCTYDCTFDEECPEDFRCSPRGRCERGCRITNNGEELCDQVDNDCDGQTDEDWPDLGQACQNGTCPEGVWICSLDGLTSACDGPEPQPADTTCDDFDDDCDGDTDEDAVDIQCPLQASICADTWSTCVAGAGYSECDYGPEFTSGLDDSCNQVDNDCDGVTDEDSLPVLEPEAGAQATDGLDNNCNGLTDEPGGVMVPVFNFPGVWIDTFEASIWDNPDCTGTHYGQAAYDYPADWPLDGTGMGTLYACSLRGVIPSAYLSYQQANLACQAQGKRLCTIAEYNLACGEDAGAYPYSPIFLEGSCNDPFGGAGQVEPTGTRVTCTTPAGLTFDMSGNLAEYVHELSSDNPGHARVAGWSYSCTYCDSLAGTCQDCDPGNPDQVENLQEVLMCYPVDNWHNTFALAPPSSWPFIGTRCCMDGPP